MPYVNLGHVVGPKGDRGKSLFTGEGAPVSDPSYQNGDSYIDTYSWNVYSYNGSSWSLVGNIEGSAGSQGPQGERGPRGYDGPIGPTGQAAGIGAVSASASAETGASGTSAGAQVTASATGEDTSKQFDFNFSFQIPKGADGVVTDAMGAIGFQVNADGQLLAVTASGEPNLTIDSEGQLIYTY